MDRYGAVSDLKRDPSGQFNNGHPLGGAADLSGAKVANGSGHSKANGSPVREPSRNNEIHTIARSHPLPATGAVFIGKVESKPAVIKQSKQSQWRLFNLLWNQGFALVMSYLVALTTFLIFIHVHNLPQLPFPLNKNLLDYDPDFDPYIWWPNGSTLVLVMWGIIFLRKIFLLVLWTAVKGHVFNDYYHTPDQPRVDRSRERGRCLSVFVVGFHVLFGIWTGWTCNKHNEYIITEPLLLVLGVCLFAVSEVTLVVSSVYHVAKRMSQGQWFILGKYGCEMVTWLGFALVAFTLPACLLLLVRFVLTVFLIRHNRRAECCCT